MNNLYQSKLTNEEIRLEICFGYTFVKMFINSKMFGDILKDTYGRF